MSAAAVARMPVREAYSGDVAKAKSLSGHEKLVYKVLAEHVYHPKKNQPGQRPYDGIARLRRATICAETCLSDSTVRRAINKLLALNWICLPEGDAGGRKNALKYHLHPDGCSCHLPKVPLKQREAAVKEPERASNCTPFLDPERPSVCSEKGVNLTSPHKETISSNTISSSTRTHAHAREPEGAGVVAEAAQRAQSRETKPVSPELAELQKPEIIKQFTKLQTLVKDTIQPIGKLRILRATKRHGFTLPHLRWAFEKHGGGLNMAGGLVKFAEEWEEYTAGVCLPACGKCLDAGVLECPQGDENSQGFCGCEAGRKMAQSALEREKETEVCPYCHDTGRESFQYCQCSKGLELEAEEMGLQISDLASMVNAGAVLKSSQAKIPVAWT